MLDKDGFCTVFLSLDLTLVYVKEMFPLKLNGLFLSSGEGW